MVDHSLTLPVSREDIMQLRAGDTVYLNGMIYATAGMPTHDRLLGCLDDKEALPFDFQGQALFHLGSMNYEKPDGEIGIHYMNPTTSTRFNPHMPRLIPGLGLRMTGGKGGLDANCAAVMAKAGCVYLSFLGGGAPIITAGIKRIVAVGWPEMIEHYRIVQMEVEQLGPLVVGIDAHGKSTYDDAANTAQDRRDAILAKMRADREAHTL